MFNRLLCSALLAVLCSRSVNSYAVEVQAYAGVVAGLASGNGGFDCATSGPTIGNGWGAGISLPTEGFSFCHLAGGIDNHAQASGTVSATQAVTGPTKSGQYIGSADAHASIGVLGVAASGHKDGGTSNFNFDSSAAFARFEDVLTIHSASAPDGAVAKVNFGFHIEGSMSMQSQAPYSQQADVALGLRVNSTGGPFDLFQVTLASGSPPFIRGGSTGLPGALVVTPTSVSGAVDVLSSANFAVTLGVPFSFEVALRTVMNPCCFGTAMNVDFFNTARLSAIDVAVNGTPLTNFTVSAASGVAYSATGAAPVPLPPALPLFVPVLLALLSRRRHTWATSPSKVRRQDPHRCDVPTTAVTVLAS